MMRSLSLLKKNNVYTSSSWKNRNLFIRFVSKKTTNNEADVVEETLSRTLKRDGSVGPISSARYATTINQSSLNTEQQQQQQQQQH